MKARTRFAAFGEVMMRLQTPGVELLTQANTLQYSFSGTGVNIAAALHQLGYEAYVVTTLPDNPLGEAAVSHIRKLGIRDTFIERGGRYLGMYFLESGFGSRPGRVTYTNRLESSFNTAREGTYDYEGIAEQVDMIHLCGISLAMNDQVRQSMISLATAVRKCGGTVIFDCNYRPSLWARDGFQYAKPYYERMLHLATIVMMNEQDAIHILGMTTNQEKREEQLLELIPQVANQYGITAVAGTHRTIHDQGQHSLRGYLYQSEQQAFAFSKQRTFPVFDRIGAGDAYTSGIIHGISARFPMERTVEFAVAAAVHAHTIAGDTPLATERDILDTMSSSVQDLRR